MNKMYRFHRTPEGLFLTCSIVKSGLTVDWTIEMLNGDIGAAMHSAALGAEDAFHEMETAVK